VKFKGATGAAITEPVLVRALVALKEKRLVFGTVLLDTEHSGARNYFFPCSGDFMRLTPHEIALARFSRSRGQ
jgi:hypothetical protein